MAMDIHPDLIDEEEPYITTRSVSIFLKTVAENKIWNDNVIRGQNFILYTFMAGSDPRWNGEDNQEAQAVIEE